jgi:hypothetical protein
MSVPASRATVPCELHPHAWRQFGNSLQELKQLAAGYGWRIWYLDQQSEIGGRSVQTEQFPSCSNASKGIQGQLGIS